MGSWLEGTPAGSGAASGSRLDLPADGPGSMASVLRRLVALLVDWLLSAAVGLLAVRPPESTAFPLADADPMATLAVFAVSTVVFVGVLGSTLGHRLLGLRVAHPWDVTTGRPPGLVAALVRTVLLCLVIPPAIWDRDGRGLHDVAARTVIVRR